MFSVKKERRTSGAMLARAPVHVGYQLAYGKAFGHVGYLLHPYYAARPYSW